MKVTFTSSHPPIVTIIVAIAPPPRAGSILLLVNEKLLLMIGGANGEGQHFNDVWAFNLGAVTIKYCMIIDKIRSLLLHVNQEMLYIEQK